jgi:hypothetical protein
LISSIRMVSTVSGLKIYLLLLKLESNQLLICIQLIHISCTSISRTNGLVSFTTSLLLKIGGLRMIQLMERSTSKLLLLVE